MSDHCTARLYALDGSVTTTTAPVSTTGFARIGYLVAAPEIDPRHVGPVSIDWQRTRMDAIWHDDDWRHIFRGGGG